MDGSRFDALVRAAAGAPSRRSLLGAALGGVVAVVVGSRADAAQVKRAPGEVCHKDGDCASGLCLHKDATGRRYCGCVAAADCPAPTDACAAAACAAGVCTTTALGGVGSACTAANFYGGAPIGSPGTGCCGDLVCHGLGVAPGLGTCDTNRAPVAVALDNKHPFDSACIPVTLYGYDPECDAIELVPVTQPSNGFLIDSLGFQGGGAYAGAAPGGGAAAGVRALRLDPNLDAQCTPGCGLPSPVYGSVENSPVEWGSSTHPQCACAEGCRFYRIMCYVPFASTFTGTDSFTYAGIDVFGAQGPAAVYTMTIFEV